MSRGQWVKSNIKPNVIQKVGFWSCSVPDRSLPDGVIRGVPVEGREGLRRSVSSGGRFLPGSRDVTR